MCVPVTVKVNPNLNPAYILDEILMIDDLISPCGENDIKMWKNIIIQQNKINELIDEINNLKEK